MVGPGQLVEFEEPLASPKPGWVTVEVIGCGVCHTDLSYLYGGVPTATKGPLVLGHEIVGRVAGTDRTVIVPAVSPCGECAACKRGRRTACASSVMPGNHHDGGFATHVQVPERWLCDVPKDAKVETWQLSVIADAVTTPFQAIERAKLQPGEAAIVVGVGGVGGFLVQIAAAVGAVPVALDVSPDRLARAQAHGAVAGIDVRNQDPKALRKAVAAALAPRGLAPEGWHIFECSGVSSGQGLAFGLLTRGATLSVIGFSAEALPLKLSNLMALDAEAYGNWGCDPTLYAGALDLVLSGKVDLSSTVVRHPLSDAPKVFEAAHHGQLDRRAVLVP